MINGWKSYLAIHNECGQHRKLTRKFQICKRKIIIKGKNFSPLKFPAYQTSKKEN